MMIRKFLYIFFSSEQHPYLLLGLGIFPVKKENTSQCTLAFNKTIEYVTHFEK